MSSGRSSRRPRVTIPGERPAVDELRGQPPRRRRRGDRASETNAAKLLLTPRKIAIARIGSSSPTAPDAMKYVPKGPVSMPRSRRIGSTVPSAVVVRASATGTKALTKPAAASPPTTADGEHGRCHPGDQRQPAGLGDHQSWLDLEARQQEDETEPDIGDQLDRLSLDEVEHLRADEDPADDQQYHLGIRSHGSSAATSEPAQRRWPRRTVLEDQSADPSGTSSAAADLSILRLRASVRRRVVARNQRGEHREQQHGDRSARDQHRCIDATSALVDGERGHRDDDRETRSPRKPDAKTVAPAEPRMSWVRSVSVARKTGPPRSERASSR